MIKPVTMEKPAQTHDARSGHNACDTGPDHFGWDPGRARGGLVVKSYSPSQKKSGNPDFF